MWTAVCVLLFIVQIKNRFAASSFVVLFCLADWDSLVGTHFRIATTAFVVLQELYLRALCWGLFGLGFDSFVVFLCDWGTVFGCRPHVFEHEV